MCSLHTTYVFFFTVILKTISQFSINFENMLLNHFNLMAVMNDVYNDKNKCIDIIFK